MALQEEDPYRFRRILAITFTNKAAAEMKERVIQVLHDIAAPNGPLKPANITLFDTLKTELNLPAIQLKNRAAKTLSAILHQYSDFAIGTIDSFMHRVVRTFAHDLHLPVNFSVELDQEVILRQAIEHVLEKVGDDEAITRAMIGFTESRTDDEKNMSVQEELYSAGSDLLREQSAMVIRKLNQLNVTDFLNIRTKLMEECRETEQLFHALGKKALEVIRAGEVEVDDFYYGKKGIGRYFAKMARMESGEDLSPNSYQEKTLTEGIWMTKKTAPEIASRIANIQDELDLIGNEARNLWSAKGPDYLLQNMLKDSIYSIALLNEISRMIDHIRDDQFIVHISEFNRRVADIVFNEPAPFIFERLGEKYHHYLIDEFQDTSVLQWQNLLPLVQNGLSENYPSLIVGDGKQAIYRFRGGEVEQFAQLPQPYPDTLKDIQKERYRLLQDMFSPKTLDTNFRSSPEVISFNNRLYEFIQQHLLPEAYRNVYDEQTQKAPEGKTGGYVRLDLAPADLDKAGRDQFHLDRSLEIIRDLTINKGYRPRDIALLTRNNKQGTLLAGHLLNNGIPVISSESLLVQNAPEVGMLVSWMQILIGSNTALNLFSVCTFLLQQKKLPYTSVEDLLLHVRMDEKTVLKMFNQHNLHLDLALLRRMSLLECCFSICETFHIEIQSNTYLQFFLEAVWNTGRSQAMDIPLFLEFWEEKRNKLSIALPQDANAVRIMTVHKSKGLQFPVVILPFAYGEKAKTTTEWVDDEELLPAELLAARVSLNQSLKATRLSGYVTEEEDRRALDAINLLYVATTRAEDALFILSGRSGVKGSLQSGWEKYLEEFALFEQPDDFAHGCCKWGDDTFINNRSEDQKPEVPSVVHAYTGSKWQSRITISRNAPKNWEVGDESSAIALGKLVHRALAYIHTADQIDIALNRLMGEGVLDHHSFPEMQQLLTSVIEHPTLKSLFDTGNTVFNERQLLLPDGKIVIPDRVTENAGAITILDYKTGLRREEHQIQVRNYLSQLKELTYTSYKAYLVYLGKEIEVEEVYG